MNAPFNSADLKNHNTPSGNGGQQTSSSANTGGPVTEPDNWAGDHNYFQTGKKAGTLKPSAKTERVIQSGKSTTFSMLDLDSLRATTKDDSILDPVTPDKKAQKLERKLVEAKIAAKFVMRILDTLTGWVSGGTFGADFTDAQRKERNKYRDDLEQDWADYLITLDVPMHPAIVAIFGSILYVAPAMQTEKGAERVSSFREKIVSKIAVKFFGGRK